MIKPIAKTNRSEFNSGRPPYDYKKDLERADKRVKEEQEKFDVLYTRAMNSLNLYGR